MPNVIFADSFDHYATADIGKKYTAYNSSAASITSAAGRNGTNGLRCTSDSSVVQLNVGPRSALYVECAFKMAALPIATRPIVVLLAADGATAQVTLALTAAGEWEVHLGAYVGTRLNTTSGFGFQTNTWYHVGFYATANNTTGAYELRINGVTWLSGSNIDTQNAGADSTIGGVQLSSAKTSTAADFDDFVISTDGFCGDCRVMALLPSGAGNYSQWSVPATAYGYPGGMGDRTGSIAVAQAKGTAFFSAWSASTCNGVIDGATTNNSSFANAGAVDGTAWVSFDFGSARVITEATTYCSVTSATTMGVWKWQGSQDNSAWADIGTSFTWTAGTSAHTSLSSNVTAYRYYRIVGVSGATSATGPFLNEFEFKIDAAPSAYQTVDDAQLNNDNDYVYSSTGGQRSTYTFPSLGVTGNIKAVQHVSTLRKDDAGTRTAKQTVRIGGTNYDGADISVADSYVMQRRIMTTSPATSAAWNSADLNNGAIEAGTLLVS